MRGGTSVRTSVSSPKFTGETLPSWIPNLKGHPSHLDVSAVIHDGSNDKKAKRLSLAVINRAERDAFVDVPVRVAFDQGCATTADVYELWDEDVKAVNRWEDPDRVRVHHRRERWGGKWTFKEHSFTLLIIELN